MEGTTELGAITVLAGMMPEPLDLDRCNCSVIEVGGKENLPLFIKMMIALQKRVLVVYDTDSHQEAAQDKETNARRKKDIERAFSGEANCYQCDPYLEHVAGIEGSGKKDKEGKVREFLASLNSWDDVPNGLRTMMERVSSLATPEA